MNLNELAKAVTLEEAGKKQVSIAQVKEVMRILAKYIYTNEKALKAMLRLGKKHSE